MLLLQLPNSGGETKRSAREQVACKTRTPNSQHSALTGHLIGKEYGLGSSHDCMVPTKVLASNAPPTALRDCG